MASISSDSASFTLQEGAAAIRHHQQRRWRQQEMDARMTAHLNHNQQHDHDGQRLAYQRQLQEEEYNRSIASPGGEPSSHQMSRQQLVQRRLERRRQERRLRANDLQSRTATQSQPIHQPPPPPPSGTSPRSIMKKSSSYQTMPDQQYFHNQQRQPQHASSNYSSDSSGNYISPPILNRKQAFPDEASPPSQSNQQVFTQNGVVIDRTAFRPTRNRLRLPHESPSDEWSRNNGSPVNQSRFQRGQYQQQYHQNPQIYVPDTPSHSSVSYDKPLQMRRNNRQPNWKELDQQQYQRQQLATQHRGHMGQQQNISYVSDDEDTYNDRRVNASFNTQTNTPVMNQNRSRSLSGERQIPRRWRHKRAAASVGRGSMSQSSVSTPLSAEDSPQFHYTPRSRLAVSESLRQPELNTPKSSHSPVARSSPLRNDRHGWRQHNNQRAQNQQSPAINYEWVEQDNRPYSEKHARQQNLVSPTRSEVSNYSDADQDSVSVASIRKSWEGRVEQQRGRTQGGSYDRRRNTGENQYQYGWREGRDNQGSHWRQGEQRREQRRNVDNRWRRNSSLPPPERRRGGGLRYEQSSDADGYQSDGGYRNQPDRVEVDSAHVTIHDARRRLWDQEERLRAVLPPANSFDSAADFRNHKAIPSVGLASPGNVSTLSTGSALFKSKFVHAAALATQRRGLAVSGGNQNNFHYQKKAEDESPKGSSQITDSTADTTAPSSNHTSHGDNARSSQYTKQSAQPTATMPSIAEAPQSSVADLIARINAVSRDNPAEALARIDSIIKGESVGGTKPRQQDSGVSNLFKFDAPKKQGVTSKAPWRNNDIRKDPPVDSNDEQKFAFEDANHEDEQHDEDPSVGDSLTSSESTVSSMTNPTYQSLHETKRRKSSNKQPPSPTVVTTRSKGAESQSSKEKKGPRSNRSGNEGALTEANVKSLESNNNWTESAPQSDFFNEFGGFRNASNQAIASSRTMPSKKSSPPRIEKKVPKRPATPDIMNAVSSAFSDVNISFGDTAGVSQDLLATALSDLDQTVERHNKSVMNNAFSNVDVNMEQKTVKQRRNDLELLSKSFAGAGSLLEDAGSIKKQQVSSPGFSWDTEEPTPQKEKKKTEPTLRLKSNKKLTQKFANLVKAFEK